MLVALGLPPSSSIMHRALSPVHPPVKRPRGIWASARTAATVPLPSLSPAPAVGIFGNPAETQSDTDEDEEDSGNNRTLRSFPSTSSFKRRRLAEPSHSRSSSGANCTPCTGVPLLVLEMKPAVSTPRPSARQSHRVERYDYEDWLALKAAFADATMIYNGDDPTRALPPLRAVIDKCGHFLTHHGDPSVLFTSQPSQPTCTSPQTLTPLEERLERDWDTSSSPSHTADLPTAFHTLLGIALFLYGNLLSQAPSLVDPSEHAQAETWWLAALDIFEAGENLPSRSSNRAERPPEDWQLALAWGRTLVQLAGSRVSSPSLETGLFPAFHAPPPKPTYSPGSVLAAIAACRPALTRRMSLARATADELLVLAVDQLSRGIFHMPHPAPTSTTPAGGKSKDRGVTGQFEREQELFNTASEVLAVAGGLTAPRSRVRWARWADSVLAQMSLEGASTSPKWRRLLTCARGRAALVAAQAGLLRVEEATRDGECAAELMGDVRTDFEEAIRWFGEVGEGQSGEDVRGTWAEAVVGLANITEEEGERQKLFERAKEIGRGIVRVEMDDMKMDEN